MKKQLTFDFTLLFRNKALYISIAVLFAAGMLISAEDIKAVFREESFLMANVLFYTIGEKSLFSDLFRMLVPILSAMAFSGMFKEELSSRVLVYGLSRTTRRRYLCSKVIVTVIGGGLTVLAASVLIYVVLAALLPVDEVQRQLLQEHWPSYIKGFLLNLGVLFLNGALWALFGGVCSVLFREKYVAYSAPFICYYVMSEFQKRYYGKWYLLSPANWANPFIRGYGTVYLILILVIIVLCLVYGWFMRVRIQEG